MTRRNHLKLIARVAARKSNPQTLAEFRRCAAFAFDVITDPLLMAELDRIDEIYQGYRRLCAEVWNEFQKEQREDADAARWLARAANEGGR